MEMTEKEINRIVSNEKEWRKLILSEIRTVKKEVADVSKSQNNMALEMNTLKVKVAIFGSAFGGAAGIIAAWIIGKL
jgi:hypothetical protein